MSKNLSSIMSSKTKYEIIKYLSKGQKTPTDISRAIGKAKSTVVEHLEELVNNGLVQKIEEPGKKFVFYYLTKNGYRLMETKPMIENFITIGSFISILIGISLIVFKPTNRLYSISAEKISTNYTPILFFIIGVIGISYIIFKRLKK